MNKKNIVLILILTVFLSIMAISVWGKVPDPNGNIEATSITFYDKDNNEITNTTDTRDKEKIIEILIEDDDRHTIIYNFSLVLGPENTTDRDVYVTVNYGEVALKETTVNETDDKGYSITPIKHTYEATFLPEQQENLKLDFTFNKKGVTKHDYLLFKFNVHRHDIIII